MSVALELVILILACYRLARLIAIDDGPFDIFLKIRTRLGSYDYGTNGLPMTNTGRGIKCPYCVGVWVAIPLAIYLGGIGWYTLLYWLAIAGGQTFLEGLRDNA